MMKMAWLKGWPYLLAGTLYVGFVYGWRFVAVAGILTLWMAFFVYVVTIWIVAIGGMWVTRNVKHANRYGFEQDKFPLK